MWAKKDDVYPGAWMAGPANAPPLCAKHSCSVGLGKMHVAQATWKHRKIGQTGKKKKGILEAYWNILYLW